VIPGLSGKRVAIVGIGNELNGDDAAGVLVARKLLRKKEALEKAVSAPGPDTRQLVHENVLIIDAGPVPENFSGILRRFHPELVILVDAADMKDRGGSFALVDVQDVDASGGSTHIQPLSLFANFLIEEIGCQVVFLGIQPVSLDYCSPISGQVKRTIAKIAHMLGMQLGLE
jgi:hydrogenase 3 maturation protease